MNECPSLLEIVRVLAAAGLIEGKVFIRDGDGDDVHAHVHAVHVDVEERQRPRLASI